MTRVQKGIYTAILLLVAIAEGADGFLDFLADGWTFAVILDGAIVLLVILGSAYIIRSSSLALRVSRTKLEQIQRENEEFRRINRNALDHMWEGIAAQFQFWKLSAVESQVAEHLIRGYSMKQIAAMLGKSERTVRNQARAVYEKSGMTGRSDLAAFFIQDVVGESDD